MRTHAVHAAALYSRPVALQAGRQAQHSLWPVCLGKGGAPGVAPRRVAKLVLRSQAPRVTCVCPQTLGAGAHHQKILLIFFVKLRNCQSNVQEILPCSASLASGQNRRVGGSAVGRHLKTVLLLTIGSCCHARPCFCTRSTYNLGSGIPACAADSRRHAQV